ncbi:hypothetical protein BKA93DRAFT_471941 [Sparassis latifolia]
MDSPLSRGRGYMRYDDIEDFAMYEGPGGRGRGDASPYDRGGRGRTRPGRGFSASRQRAGVPLSKLLQEDRPLLRPIVFVRSVHTATLFQEEEDILQGVVEAAGDDEQSHVPTASKVAQVFSGADAEESDNGDNGDSSSADQLEEIGFADIGKVQAEVDAAAASVATKDQRPSAAIEVNASEEKFTGFYVDTEPTRKFALPTKTVLVEHLEGALGDNSQDDEDVIVYAAPYPRTGRVTPAVRMPPSVVLPVPATSMLSGLSIPETAPADVQEAVTTLVAERSSPAPEVPAAIQESPIFPTVELSRFAPEVPCSAENPSSSVAQEVPPSTEANEPQSEVPIVNTSEIKAQSGTLLSPEPSFESFSFSSSFAQTPPKKQPRRMHPVGGARSLLMRSRMVRRRSLKRGFGVFGAMMDELRLREGRERDPREAEQRRGDSDVNWGDDSDEVQDRGDEVEELSNGIGAMDLDVDISVEAMRGFVKSMSAEGSRHITMNDIEDADKMKMEDSNEGTDVDSESESGDEEVERAVLKEEEILVAEADDAKIEEYDDDEDDQEEDEDDEEQSTGDEATPRSSFQARLQRIRENAKEKRKAEPQGDSSDEAMSVQMTWADRDDDVIADIEEMLAENAHILHGRDRKQRKALFRAVQNGDFDSDESEDTMQPAPKRRDADIPPELKYQWEKDRARKAENKRKRQRAILEAAADPLAQHKGGKKGRKAMLAASRLEASIEVPNRVIDMVTLEQQIRRFLADIGGPNTMALLPADKATRMRIHELALAFNLKSLSKGKGNARYTTLIRTSRSGIGINKKKIARILRADGTGWDTPGRGGKNAAASLAKHREGEEVGKAAPKIGESNIGFKMLAAMGWTEGDRIGLSGGLDAPLTAIMKKTKLGLGATL